MSLIRKTKSVDIILTYFEKSKEAIAVVDLVTRVKQQMNKTTVYRILERLEKSGVIHSFTGKGGLTWYAKCNHCSEQHHNDIHPHFECKTCGKVECLDINVELPKVNNRHIDSVDIFLTGQCIDCMNN